jgi:hypothetical protein
MVEHLEFGHCRVIDRDQFLGHIVHKHLVTELLKGGATYDRFMQKISRFDATQDYVEEGGVGIDNVLDEEDEDAAQAVEYTALKPDYTQEEAVHPGYYPPLPSSQGGQSVTGASELTETMSRMSIGGSVSKSTTAVGSTNGEEGSSSGRQLKPWSGRSSKQLFPDAKSTPVPSEFSIAAHDEQMEQEYGINIMSTRFWDPLHSDWNPERFFDAIIQKYVCPFICE